MHVVCILMLSTILVVVKVCLKSVPLFFSCYYRSYLILLYPPLFVTSFLNAVYLPLKLACKLRSILSAAIYAVFASYSHISNKILEFQIQYVSLPYGHSMHLVWFFLLWHRTSATLFDSSWYRNLMNGGGILVTHPCFAWKCFLFAQSMNNFSKLFQLVKPSPTSGHKLPLGNPVRTHCSSFSSNGKLPIRYLARYKSWDASRPCRLERITIGSWSWYTRGSCELKISAGRLVLNPIPHVE